VRSSARASGPAQALATLLPLQFCVLSPCSLCPPWLDLSWV